MKESGFVFVILLSLLLSRCDNTDRSSESESNGKQIFFQGNALGTYYTIRYYDEKDNNLQNEIEELLVSFNKSLSTFDSTSVISKINKNVHVKADRYFLTCFRRAMEISELTSGAFDITVAPLVNAWNFGFSKRKHPDSINIEKINIDSMLAFTGYAKISVFGDSIIKTDKRIMLDASAIAKGYAVDVVAEYLESKGIENYLVEIGGEVRAKGNKPNKSRWKIGIDKPVEQLDKIIHEQQAVVFLKEKSLATSGNYRQFYEKDGVKYSHTINPSTGFPVNHNLLSATVLANDCMSADAFATAFMVMGFEKSVELLKNLKEIDAYLIYYDNGKNKVYYTEGFSKCLK